MSIADGVIPAEACEAACADPVLSANIYCAGALDAVVCEVAYPFWRDVCGLPGAKDARMWMVRYARRGEHLKVRVHGPAALRDTFKQLLSRRADAYLGRVTPLPEITERDPRVEIPAVDAADEGTRLHADGTLLWTLYRRSAVSLGGEPLLSDDRYVTLITRCLGAGCQLAMATLCGSGEGACGTRERHNALLRAVVDLLAVLGWAPLRHASYIRYHQGWLLRSAADGHEDRTHLLALFADESHRLNSSIEMLRILMQQHPGSPATATGVANPEAVLSWSVVPLVKYLTQLTTDQRYHVDPTAADPVFPGVFKVLHGLANQLGLNIVNEALVYHLLLRAIGTSEEQTSP